MLKEVHQTEENHAKRESEYIQWMNNIKNTKIKLIFKAKVITKYCGIYNV